MDEMTAEATTDRLMTIGEVARTAGVATPTLRYYEQEGLLSPTTRSRAGYRLYDARAIEQLRFIRSAQAVGFTPDDIAQLLTENESMCRRISLRERSSSSTTTTTGVARAPSDSEA